MRELQEILKTLNENGDEKMILATVVDVKGSGYRRAGARMLIDKNGFSIGTVSGGCLEADVLARAKKVLATGAPTVITYDTTADENSVFGLGMGCRGIIRVLLEAVTGASDFIVHAADNLSERAAFVLATLIETAQPDLPVGTRLFFDETGVVFNNFDRETLAAINTSVRRAFADQSQSLEIFDFGEVFVETIKPPLSLLLFGAGFDALPVVRFAKELGWRVTVVDHRPAFANAERLPEADALFAARGEDLPEELFRDEHSAAVMMTHNYERDGGILHRLLNSDCRYIGALGPKTRTQKLIAELRAEGRIFNEANLEKLYAPVGLDIGSETPEEIALAVVAEIKTALSNRCGGFLRERQGAIND